jgi:hypothetical protein
MKIKVRDGRWINGRHVAPGEIVEVKDRSEIAELLANKLAEIVEDDKDSTKGKAK